ncbi:hypothetical protein BH10BAC5_BH10BAC5_15150 [soil metagenome]
MSSFWKRNLIFIASLAALYVIFLSFTFLNNPERFKAHEPQKKKTYYGVRNKSLPVDLKKGPAVFRIMYEGFTVDMDLVDELGNKMDFYVNDLIEEKYSSRKITEITEDGKYYIDVKAKGYWSITVEENVN